LNENDVEWTNDGRTAIINGWYFHFNDMCAVRGHGQLKRVLLDVHNDCVCSVRHEATDTRLIGVTHGRYEWGGIWRSFFTEPEERFNQVIDEAYQTYLLETAINSIPKQ
jgi:hypothetical protein